MGKITVEIDLDVQIAESKLIRAALNVAEHLDHSVARAELQEAANAYLALLRSKAS
jgi:hypothetical protein